MPYGHMLPFPDILPPACSSHNPWHAWHLLHITTSPEAPETVMRSSESCGCPDPSAASGTLLDGRSKPLYPPYNLTAGTRTARRSGRYVRAHSRVQSLSTTPTIAVHAVDRERAFGGSGHLRAACQFTKPHAAAQNAARCKALSPQHACAMRPCASTLIGTLLTPPCEQKGPMVYSSRAPLLAPVHRRDGKHLSIAHARPIRGAQGRGSPISGAALRRRQILGVHGARAGGWSGS